VSGRIPPDALGAYGDGPWRHPEFDLVDLAPRRTRYALCVFVLNEDGRLHAQLRKMRATKDLADIVVADGGSTDGSVEAEAVGPLGVRAVLVKRGPGRLGAQMRMAFAWALGEGYEGVVAVDGNDKDDVPGALPEFIRRLDGGYDHVQGSRFIRGGRHENTPWSRHLGVRALHAPLIGLASGFPYTDTTNGFRAYSRRFLGDPRVRVFRDGFSGYDLHYYLAIEAAQGGFRVCEVPVTRVYPRTGKTPTTISPVRGSLALLKVLFRTVFAHSKRFRRLWG
jgi:glycosyltransferase involved in cell wall biosynthesis